MHLVTKPLKSYFTWAAFLFSLFLFAPLPGFAAAKEAATSKAVQPPCYPCPPMTHPIRIGIATRVPYARIAIWAPGAVFVNNRPVALLKAGSIYTFTPGRMQEAATGKIIELPVDQRAQISASDYRVWTSNRWWRGALEIMAVRNMMTVVNYLDLEDYLQGVVPSEMPSSWQIEALKAQAVAARSYAWAHMGPGRSKWFSNEGYDLVPDVRDQAYKGLAAEAPSTRLAVWSTHGIILSDSGKVKAGFYRAWVGENPETNLNIRRKDVPNALLEKITGVPQILGVTVKQYDGLFNAHSVQVMGAKKTREVSGVALAKMLNFSTAGILDIRQNGNNWLFTFRGPGNGALGLSQNGANMLAKNGWKFDQILQQYYQDPDGKLRFDSTDRQQYAMQQHMVPAAATAEGP